MLKNLTILSTHFGLGLMLAASATLVSAQTTLASAPETADLGTSIPDRDSIRDGLFPEDKCAELVASGFKCMGVKPTVTFSLPAVAFAFGSAVLPDSLKRQLDVFAEVLSSKRGSNQTVRIVGHADSSGSASGNTSLSQKRAEEVKRYLVTKGAEDKMLSADGVGSKDLLKPDTPTSAENRRVTLGR